MENIGYKKFHNFTEKNQKGKQKIVKEFQKKRKFQKIQFMRIYEE